MNYEEKFEEARIMALNRLKNLSEGEIKARITVSVTELNKIDRKDEVTLKNSLLELGKLLKRQEAIDNAVLQLRSLADHDELKKPDTVQGEIFSIIIQAGIGAGKGK